MCWYYIIRPCRNQTMGWVGMAKRSPFVTDGDLMREPGEIWFQFGKTEADAKDMIEIETRQLCN